MSLQNLLQNNKIEKISSDITTAKTRLNKAYKLYHFVENNLSNSGNEEILYSQIYDSMRLACTAILDLNGYRVKTSGPGHHMTTIEAAMLLTNNELANEFKRIQKMRKNRNTIEYGCYLTISTTELKQGRKDASILLERVNQIIGENEPKLSKQPNLPNII